MTAKAKTASRASAKAKSPKRKTASSSAAKRSSARRQKETLGQLIAGLTVTEAVKGDLAKIGERDPELATSGLAANALRLAKEMDSDSSATSKSMCARALNETMRELKELLPPEAEPDAIDELAKKRAARRAKAVAS